MSKEDLLEANDAMPPKLQVRGVEDAVDISLIKEAGATSCKRHFTASSPEAAINALGILVADVADILEMPVGHILSVLATVLIGSAGSGA